MLGTGVPYYCTPNLYPLIQALPNGIQQMCPSERPHYGFCPQPVSYRLSFTCNGDDPTSEVGCNCFGVEP